MAGRPALPKGQPSTLRAVAVAPGIWSFALGGQGLNQIHLFLQSLGTIPSTLQKILRVRQPSREGLYQNL